MPKENLAKIFFELHDKDDNAPSTESLWAEHVKENQFRVDNNPFFIYGVSYNDIVEVIVKEDNLFFSSVVRHNGHSTFRIFFNILDPKPQFIKDQLKIFNELGCSYEGNGSRLYSIDVPPTSDLKETIKLLQEGEDIGKWEYEEGFVYRE